MSSFTFGQRSFTPVPPEKGSFPLDHEGICRDFMIKYMRCLMDNKNIASNCKDISKDYLACRMDNGLMAREEWTQLGFGEKEVSEQQKQ
ncbi:cytochrome c oxidase assembly protein COX19 [Nasonia vitripennis]|uniref:Cytochrome c oxidase assembly protein COX19 n=1 Tax=Nasonia vitripennis TaxID=7425 RepID=A0A7M7Q4J7_NASVI|nr:cytochrome c oxidase assembly protein COX19 [Nasonia vitripennis]XP_032452713.1 cytochrome c oxidase assembly protein COX19 [Nasonia vitripennis]